MKWSHAFCLLGMLHLFASCVAVGGQDQGFDLILRGGLVYDGAGGEPYRADVAILGKKIAAVGDLSEARTLRSFDVAGLVVLPGFFETVPEIGDEVLDEVKEGVTTLVIPRGHLRKWTRKHGLQPNVLELVGWKEAATGQPLAAFLASVRGEGDASPAETVRSLSYDRARALGVSGRGLVLPGYFADLVVLDAGGIAASAGSDRAGPVRHVCVNGTTVLRDAHPLPARPGRILVEPYGAR